MLTRTANCRSIGMVFLLAVAVLAQAQESKFGLSLRGGAGRIEGDIRKSSLRALGSAVIFYAPDPHLWIGIEGGYGEFITDQDTQVDSLVRLTPAALTLTFNFSPYKTVSPFATLGAGGIFWRNFRASDKENLYSDPERNDSAMMLKAAGGLNFALSDNLLLTVGGDFSYFLNDHIDLLAIGDEDDGLLSGFAGFTINFGGGKPDRDHDRVFDRYDLDSNAKEDRDGYMDHDGVPDTQTNTNFLAMGSTQDGSGAQDDVPPIVIHRPLRRATAGKDLHIRAEIFENRKLLKSAVLYRPYNVKRWLVEPMVSGDNEVFEAVLPGTVIPTSGLEYCVVAVDEAISGIGYSGLPNRPNYVMVHGKETWWRVATAVAAVGGWGAASYLITRDQK